MNAEILCVGSELLSGKVLNTNAQYIAKALGQLGHTCSRQLTVDDNKANIKELVKNSVHSCDLLIVTGGLGPTEDDVTKEAVCEALGLKLVENKICKKHLESYFNRLGKTPTANNFRQITAPEGATIFKNERGTACGIFIEHKGKKIILLPGPPKELTYMVDSYVVPVLKKYNSNAIVTHTVNVFGMGESAIETALQPIITSKNPVIATYCKENECEVSVTATAKTAEEAEKLCSTAIFNIKALLGDVVYGTDSDSLAHEVVNLLKKNGLKVATAESCTGGMLSQSLTSVSGASEVVEIGILAYSNRIKNEALSVPHDVLLEEGAISAETAMYLAKNVRILSGSDIGVGITGNAGPSASENKPVGLVYVAIADKERYYIKKLTLPASYGRDKIRSCATLWALDLVRKYTLAQPNGLDYMRSLEEDFFFDESEDTINATVPVGNFAVFEVDKDYVFDDDVYEPYEELTSEKQDLDVIIDIDSFVPAQKTEPLELLNKCKSFFMRHWKKCVCALIVLALIMSSSVLAGNFAHESHQIKLLENARKEFNFDSADTNKTSGIFSSFDALMKDNSDIKAWLTIGDTKIDNPVYQTNNNKYYQSHNMAKEKSRYGALFFDKDNTIKKDAASKNLTIYGNNTENGTMFGDLDLYHSLSFYKKNPTIKLKTLYSQNEYLIFAVFIANSRPQDDNGSVFNYTQSSFESYEEFSAFVQEARRRSLISVPIEFGEQDELLTLSTSSLEFENARFVVMAKRITADHESNAAALAVLNANAKYPQAWYDKNNLSGYEEKVNLPSSSTTESSSEIVSSDTNVSSNESSSEISSTQVSSTISSNTVQCNHTYSDKYENKTAESHSFKCTKCGTLMTETHDFSIEKVDNGYLNTAATCYSKATYFKSCKCGIKGSETFQSGDLLQHNISTALTKDDNNHWNACQNAGCQEKQNIAAHVFEASGFCVCGQAAPTAPTMPDNTPPAP